MYDGYRKGDERYRRRSIADRVAHSMLSMLTLEGVLNLVVALAIILALCSYVIFPAIRDMPKNLATLSDRQVDPADQSMPAGAIR